jgi:alpha-D-ribose 1-methylphosphonate 5-triphosphate synthase subunit PhnH
MNPAIDYDAQLVLYTQKVFRSILDSMARPGKINVIEPFPLHFAANEIDFAPFILGIASTLLDIEVGFHVVDSNLAKLSADVAFHTNSRAVSIQEADYIFMTSGDDPLKLRNAKRGNLDYPDSGAMVIMVVDSLQEKTPAGNNSGLALRLKGPGILNEKVIFVSGIAESLLQMIHDLNSEFPLGIDLILVNQERIMCLPRSITFDIKRDESWDM